jgi:hypothetical protein
MGTPTAPKLLLDASVFRDVAGGALTKRPELQAKERVEPRPGEPRIKVKSLVSSVVIEISRKHAADFQPVWGEFRTDEEQAREQREMIAFELSLLQNASNPQGYNLDKHRGTTQTVGSSLRMLPRDPGRLAEDPSGIVNRVANADGGESLF